MPTRVNNAVWLEKYARWQLKVQSNGIRKTFVCATPGRAGKAEVHRKADDWLSSQLVDSDAPISTVWNRWAATLTSKDAIKKADIFWRHYVSAACGKKRMSDITEGLIQSIIDGAAAKGLAWKSISNIRATVSAFIKWSRKNKYTDIVMDDIGIPKTAKKGKKKILQPDDLIKMWNAPEALYSNLYKADVVIGFRPGEAIGLQWSDIVGNRLHIQRAINDDGEITNGKNENADRWVWLGEYELQIFDDQREALKRRHVISPWIFPQPNGQHATQRAVRRGWKRFAETAGITPGVTPYGLRHTFVSINNEMPEGIKQRRIGHASNMDTEGVYGHSVAGEQEQAAAFVKERLDSILKPDQKPTKKPTRPKKTPSAQK